MAKDKKRKAHPADEQRRKERKKDIKRNKEKRTQVRAGQLKGKSAQEIQDEIDRIARLEASGKADEKQMGKKKILHIAHQDAIKRDAERTEREARAAQNQSIVVKGLGRIVKQGAISSSSSSSSSSATKRDDQKRSNGSDDEDEDNEDLDDEGESKESKDGASANKDDGTAASDNDDDDDIDEESMYIDDIPGAVPIVPEEKVATIITDDGILLAAPPGLRRPPGMRPLSQAVPVTPAPSTSSSSSSSSGVPSLLSMPPHLVGIPAPPRAPLISGGPGAPPTYLPPPPHPSMMIPSHPSHGIRPMLPYQPPPWQQNPGVMHPGGGAPHHYPPPPPPYGYPGAMAMPPHGLPPPPPHPHRIDLDAPNNHDITARLPPPPAPAAAAAGGYRGRMRQPELDPMDPNPETAPVYDPRARGGRGGLMAPNPNGSPAVIAPYAPIQPQQPIVQLPPAPGPTMPPSSSDSINDAGTSMGAMAGPTMPPSAGPGPYAGASAMVGPYVGGMGMAPGLGPTPAAGPTARPSVVKSSLPAPTITPSFVPTALLVRNRAAAAAPVARRPNPRAIVPNAAPDIGSSISAAAVPSQKIIYTTPLGATIKPKPPQRRTMAAAPPIAMNANASAALDSFLADIDDL